MARDETGHGGSAGRCPWHLLHSSPDPPPFHGAETRPRSPEETPATEPPVDTAAADTAADAEASGGRAGEKGRISSGCAFETRETPEISALAG